MSGGDGGKQSGNDSINLFTFDRGHQETCNEAGASQGDARPLWKPHLLVPQQAAGNLRLNFLAGSSLLTQVIYGNGSKDSQ
jgi:hypothetical protein